jgi:hypothetical protein
VSEKGIKHVPVSGEPVRPEIGAHQRPRLVQALLDKRQGCLGRGGVAEVLQRACLGGREGLEYGRGSHGWRSANLAPDARKNISSGLSPDRRK